MPEKSYVCDRCNDTHMVEDSRHEDKIMCTSCPVPCQECRSGGKGAFCETTPCACSCHAEEPKPKDGIDGLLAEAMHADETLVRAFVKSLQNRSPEEIQRDREAHQAGVASRRAIERAERALTVWDRDSMEDSECSPANWVNCERHGVPELGTYVLGRHNRGTWGDSTDQEGVNYVWLKRVLVDHYDPSQLSNNSTHYKWEPFGPDSFAGQTITDWCWVSRIKNDA